MRKRRKDTSVSLQPLTFDEAIRELAKTSNYNDSEGVVFGKSKEVAPKRETSKKRNVRHPKSSSR